MLGECSICDRRVWGMLMSCPQSWFSPEVFLGVWIERRGRGNIEYMWWILVRGEDRGRRLNVGRLQMWLNRCLRLLDNWVRGRRWRKEFCCPSSGGGVDRPAPVVGGWGGMLDRTRSAVVVVAKTRREATYPLGSCGWEGCERSGGTR